MKYTAKWKSPIGTLTIASDGTHITGLWMENQKHYCAGLSQKTEDGSSLQVIQDTIQALENYFEKKMGAFSKLPLNPQGTTFQRAVWNLLQEIPCGETRTYGQLAAALEAATGRKTSPRAIGTAVGRNPISIIIPCHRVIGADGKLIGYAGGVSRKEYLLKLENGTAL